MSHGHALKFQEGKADKQPSALLRRVDTISIGWRESVGTTVTIQVFLEVPGYL